MPDLAVLLAWAMADDGTMGWTADALLAVLRLRQQLGFKSRIGTPARQAERAIRRELGRAVPRGR